MLDYFPLVKGAIREYATENSQGAGSYRFEVLEVSTKGAVTTAATIRVASQAGGALAERSATPAALRVRATTQLARMLCRHTSCTMGISNASSPTPRHGCTHREWRDGDRRLGGCSRQAREVRPSGQRHGDGADDLPPEKWTGLSRSAFHLFRAEIAQG